MTGIVAADMRPHAGWVGIIAILAVALAAATVVQASGCNQTAHVALIKALGDGTVRIDRYEAETCDDSLIDGHYYANKAPGLALLTLPWAGALSLFGQGPVTTAPRALPETTPAQSSASLWRMTLWGTVLAALALMLLVRRVADDLVPGYGTASAVTLGLATLLLPFSALFFSHAVAALLGFAAFSVLLAERRHSSPWLTAAAGLLAGLGIVVEYPQALVALALAVYLGLQRPVARRLLAYCGGVTVGVLPLLVYDAVAFGNPFELSYTGSQIGEHERGFYGVVWPDPRVAAELLGGGKGLLTLTPVVAAGIAGLVALFRRGHRAEAATCGALVVAFLTYNAGFFEPFGGWVPGPRFLVPVLPFVALGLAAAYAERAAVVLALAAPSLAFMVAATVTSPMIPDGGPHPWLDALRNGELSETVVSLLTGDRGWTAMLPFFALVAAAIVLAIVSLPSPRVRRADLGTAALAFVVWAVARDAGPDLLGADRVSDGSAGLAAYVLLLVASCAAVLLKPRRGRLVLLAVTPLLVIAAPGVGDHTVLSLALVVTSMLLLLAASRMRPAPLPA